MNNRQVRLLCLVTRIVSRSTPKCCIETGTYRGDSTLVFAQEFDIVHSIELSEKWFAFSRKRLKTHENVFCHLGDSAFVIERLISDISEPTLFFLDAHFAGGDTAFGAEEVPLTRELNVLASRTQKDVIIVDDLRLIGKQGKSGSKGSQVYPEMNYDWREVTLASIEISIGRGHGSLWIFRDDRIMIFRNLSYLSETTLQLLFVLIRWRAAVRRRFLN
jgi:hypothetical protein